MRSEGVAAAAFSELHVASTRPAEFIDLTDRLEAAVRVSGIDEGVLHVQTMHTTTGLLINEAEPLLLEDLLAHFDRWAPQADRYAHDDWSRRTVNLGPAERKNGWSHCRAALLRSSESILVMRGRLVLGRWQRVLFAEFDGPQARRVLARLIPAA